MKIHRHLAFLLALALPAFAPLCARAQYSETAPAKVEAPAPAAGPRITFSSVHTDAPCIALTFDDGPGKATTPHLLDILAKRGVKATFFVLGENAHENPEILKREIAEGHEIGNHSWDHPNLAQKSEDAVHNQLQRTQDAVFQIAGIKPRLLRPPYGSFTDRQRKWANEQFGFKVILWDVDPFDWKKPGSSVVAHRIIENTRPGSIILVHDIHAATVDAIPEVLDTLLAKGYKFVTVSELLAMDKPKPSPSPSASPAASPTPAPVSAAHTSTKKLRS